MTSLQLAALLAMFIAFYHLKEHKVINRHTLLSELNSLPTYINVSNVTLPISSLKARLACNTLLLTDIVTLQARIRRTSH